VAEREAIPIEELTVGNEQPVSFELLERSYTYVTIHLDYPDGFRLFAVLVDPATLAVEPDYNAVRAAEEAAYRARYGRLHPSLYERLQEVDDEELLPVAVWVAQTGAGRSQEEIEAEVVVRYPAAGEARAEDGVLRAVADPDLAREIQQTYERLLFESVAVRVQPVAEWLKEQGFAVEEMTGMPALAATLLKRVIKGLNEHDDVAQIFLTEEKGMPAARIAIATDRVSHVWARGYTGAGSRIAILEPSNINATAGACLNIVATRAATAGTTVHKSAVAAVAACNNITNSPGVAPGAQILDAGHNGNAEDAVEALQWATDPASATRAHVVNESYQWTYNAVLDFTDRAYDYWVKQRQFTAAIAAGNTAGNITSPAKAFNVIAVGNVNDQNTASWSDDDMWWESAFFNPNTGVEKPEVVAPGTDIDTVAGTRTGTSMSAPQVAGLAALLMQRHGDLKNSPTAVKAIIMATAVHNIEGSARLSSVDGAGAIDVALADWMAQIRGTTGTCNAPCWWNIATTDSFPSNGGNVERTFNASRGERIRVVIAWLSYADPPTANSLDELRRNFDLNVITPNGETPSGSSAIRRATRAMSRAATHSASPG
jgi:hypothetical protein